MAMLNSEVIRQAACLAYLDNFYMLVWLLMLVIPLAWVARRPSRWMDPVIWPNSNRQPAAIWGWNLAPPRWRGGIIARWLARCVLGSRVQITR